MDAAGKQQIKRTLEHIASMRKEADKLSTCVVDIIRKDFLEYLHTRINTPAMGASLIQDNDVTVELFANENRFIVGIRHHLTPTAKQYVNKLLREYERQTPGVDCGIQNISKQFSIDDVDLNNPADAKKYLAKLEETIDPMRRKSKNAF